MGYTCKNKSYLHVAWTI